jgi:hypothetical protein
MKTNYLCGIFTIFYVENTHNNHKPKNKYHAKSTRFESNC